MTGSPLQEIRKTGDRTGAQEEYAQGAGLEAK
jgi:hypothetical protein